MGSHSLAGCDGFKTKHGVQRTLAKYSRSSSTLQEEKEHKAKEVRRDAKIRTSEESSHSRSDYSRHDGGQNGDEVNSDLPEGYSDQVLRCTRVGG